MKNIDSGHHVEACMAAIAVLLACGTLRSAETNHWQGMNTPAGTAAMTDIDDAANWSLNRVPGVGNDDVASIGFYSDQGNLVVPGDAAFNPSALIFNGCGDGSSFQADDSYLAIDKSMTLDRLKVTSYLRAGGSGKLFQQRLRIGTLTPAPVVVTLTGNGDALDMTEWNAAPQFFNIGTSNVVVDFTGNDIAFSQRQQRFGFFYPIYGGTDRENAANTANSSFRFTTPGADVFLEDQGIAGPTLNFGYCNLAVRSDQVWTADPAAYIRFVLRVPAAGCDGPCLIQSIDGGRLDNLGELNIVVTRASSMPASQRIFGGTYGSLAMIGGNSTLRNGHITQSGDVEFTRGAVLPPASDAIPAQATAYSLLMTNSYYNLSYMRYITDGHALSLAAGLKLYTFQANANAAVDIKGSSVLVGGDISISCHADISPWSATPTRAVGIIGDETSVLRLKGNYESRCRSYYDNDNNFNKNFSASTVELIGGTDVKTWEVGDAGTLTGVQKNSFSVGTLKIGTENDVGNVMLVNNHLNDNPVTQTNELDLVGEKLVVGTLLIGAGSKLDINNQAVEVGTSLSIQPGGVLDLNTGVRFTKKQRIENMVGLGDQTAAWDAAAANVIDNANRGTTFTSVYDSDADKTCWIVQSLGGGTVVTLR
ncbi:MAG: hypothetical protein ACOX9C_10005 [Kiritimatiellia bacterium]|jgi:hypothetical protein